MKTKKVLGLSLLALSLLSAASLTACGSKSNKSSSSSSSSSKSTQSSSAASKSAVSSESSSSNSSTKESSSSSSQQSKTKTWKDLSDKEKNGIFANWISNSAGKFNVYNTDYKQTIFLNVGSNGVTDISNSTPSQIVANAVLINPLDNDQFELKVADTSQTGLNMQNNLTWDQITWSTKEKLSGSDLISKYYAKVSEGEAQIQSTTSSNSLPVQ